MVKQSGHSFATLLAALGADGWELTTAIHAPGETDATSYLKRPK
jgi:hypothetical protein